MWLSLPVEKGLSEMESLRIYFYVWAQLVAQLWCACCHHIVGVIGVVPDVDRNGGKFRQNPIWRSLALLAFHRPAKEDGVHQGTESYSSKREAPIEGCMRWSGPRVSSEKATIITVIRLSLKGFAGLDHVSTGLIIVIRPPPDATSFYFHTHSSQLS